MNPLRFTEPLRAPDGVGGGAPVLTAEPAAAIVFGGPLTVAPDPSPTAEAPVVVTAPVIEPPAAVVEPVPAVAAAVAPIESEPSLLSGAKGRDALTAEALLTKKPPAPAVGVQPLEGDKPRADAAVDGAVPAVQAKVEPQPPAVKTYDAFKLPDGVTLAEAGLKEFTDIIGPAQMPQEVAQKLIDKHISEMQRIVAAEKQSSRDYWAKWNDAEKTRLREDKQLGGSRLETSLSIAKAVIETYSRTPKEAADILAAFTLNGMGNFLPIVGLFEKLGSPEMLNVFEDSIVPAHGPTTNAPKSRQDKWYGASPNKAGAPNGAP